MFEHDISVLQGEFVVLAHVLKDTPHDVPLQFSLSAFGLKDKCPRKSVTGAGVGMVCKGGQCVAPPSIYYRLLQGYASVMDTHNTLVSFRT